MLFNQFRILFAQFCNDVFCTDFETTYICLLAHILQY